MLSLQNQNRIVEIAEAGHRKDYETLMRLAGEDWKRDVPNIPVPWEGEPHHHLWQHRGIDCLMKRNQMGVWCGYAAVTKSHKLYEKGYEEVNLNAHGGLTYSAHCQDDICHPTDNHADGKVWWFGFDCGHCDDIMPVHLVPRSFFGFGHHGEYRNFDYVKKECEDLADQLVAAWE